MDYSLSIAIDAAIWLGGLILPGLALALGTTIGTAVLLWIWRTIPDLGDIFK